MHIVDICFISCREFRKRRTQGAKQTNSAPKALRQCALVGDNLTLESWGAVHGPLHEGDHSHHAFSHTVPSKATMLSHKAWCSLFPAAGAGL